MGLLGQHGRKTSLKLALAEAAGAQGQPGPEWKASPGVRLVQAEWQRAA